MFLGIPEVNRFVSVIKVSQIDDIIDRCNYYYTVLLLLFFSLLVGAKQYFGEPIKCLIPHNYPGSWANYVHDYCFVVGQYKLTPPEFEEDELMDFYDGDKFYVNYYQWIPFMLLIQSFSFYVPHFLWRSLQKLCRLDIEMTIEEAVRIRAIFGDDRRKALSNLAKYIEQFISWSSAESFGLSFLPMKSALLCTTWLYFACKLLNSANIIIQLMVINKYIGDGTFFWGLKLAERLFYVDDWTRAVEFPRVVYCDYEIVKMADVEKVNSQCALTINILNEKIYLILTLWLFLLLFCTITNAIWNIITTVMPTLREREARFYLMASLSFEDDDDSLGAVYCGDREGRFRSLSENSTVTASFAAHMRKQNNLRRERLNDFMQDCDSQEDISLKKCEMEQNLAIFMRSVLGIDGIQLIHFIRLHAGALVARDIICVLWEDFVQAKKSQNRFYERLKNWQPVLLNPEMLKVQPVTTDCPVATNLPDNNKKYCADTQVRINPTAPFQTTVSSENGFSGGSTTAPASAVNYATLIGEGNTDQNEVSLSVKRDDNIDSKGTSV